jgi:hypothetical protein
MSMSDRKTLVGLAVLLGCLLATPARADDKAACASAYTAAQSLRDARQLSKAREQLRICSRPSCTQFIARDCTTWLVEIESRIPSVVLAAKDASGADITKVTVSLDGRVIADKLDGRSIEVDPGQHTFSFALPDGRTIDQSMLVLEGQKAQRVGVTVPAAPSSTPPPVPVESQSAPLASPGPVSAETSSWNGRKTVALVTGGAGAAALVVGAVFGSMAISSQSASHDACSPGNCPSQSRPQAVSDHDAAARDATISTVTFSAGGALVAAGILLFLTAPSGSAESRVATRTGVVLMPGMSAGSAGISLSGSFR